MTRASEIITRSTEGRPHPAIDRQLEPTGLRPLTVGIGVPVCLRVIRVRNDDRGGDVVGHLALIDAQRDRPVGAAQPFDPPSIAVVFSGCKAGLPNSWKVAGERVLSLA